MERECLICTYTTTWTSSSLQFGRTQNRPFARIFNALITKLNGEDQLLPKYILIFPDKDIVANTKIFNYGIVETFQDNNKWLLVNIDQKLETRKEDLHKTRPGSVSQSSEPRLIWVQMLRRPDYTTNKEIFSLTRKYNDALEEVVSRNRHSHILMPEIWLNSANFERSGKVTLVGKEEYWLNVDEQIKQFDHYKTDLMPRSQTFTANPQRNSRYKWTAPHHSKNRK